LLLAPREIIGDRRPASLMMAHGGWVAGSYLQGPGGGFWNRVARLIPERPERSNISSGSAIRSRECIKENHVGVRGPLSNVELTTTQGLRSPTARAQIRKLRSPPRRSPSSTHKPVSSSPSPPKHLTNATKQWWRSIVLAYELEEHQFRILLLAAEALDRREQARTALRKHGLVFADDKGMIRQRPEICIERDSSTAFLRALRALKLESEGLP
jgi:phage terminase small subunit